MLGIKEIERREIEIIRAQGFSDEVSELLKEKAKEILKEEDRELVFYTDGSLSKKKGIGRKGDMGVGWLALDRIESRIVSIGNFKVVNWPMSTKAELIGIWIVILTAKCNSTVRVRTDSEQAIEMILRARNNEQYSRWIRMDNRLVLEKITSLTKQKGLKLVLEKVKGHSEDRWNNEVDLIAKEGRSSQTVLDLEDCKSDNTEYNIK